MEYVDFIFRIIFYSLCINDTKTIPYCYLFKRVPILANFSEFGKIANNSTR